MKNRNLYIMWGIFFVFCATLGFIPPKDDIFYGLCMVLSFGFFIAPSVLLYKAIKRRDDKTVRHIAIIAGCSLAVTLVTLVLNIMTVGAIAAVGNLLYYILIVVSTPMVCMQIWAISLFLWAVLLMTALRHLRSKK